MTKLGAKRKFKRTIREIATLIIQDCNERAAGWASVLIDVRGPSNGSSTVDKMRVQMPDGSRIKTLHAPLKASMLFLDVIWKIKDSAFAEKEWAGIQLSISPNGTTEIVYLYDPNCINDPAFYGYV